MKPHPQHRVRVRMRWRAVVWAGLAALLLALIARAKIGGQTGDVLGAAQQIAEIAVLFSLTP